MHPHPRPARPVGVEIALPVAPEAARHADPRRANDQLADLVAHGVARGVDHVGGHAGAGRGECRRLQRQDGVAHDDAAADLRAAGVVDDRPPPLTHDVEQPQPRVGVPRLAGAAEDADARQVMPPHRFLAMRGQGADERGRHAHLGQPVALGQRPEAIHVGVVGRAVVNEERCPQQRGPEHQPRPHHPAHVGHPVDGILGVNVHPKRHILGRLHREAAMGVDGPFRPPGGAAGVDDHQQVFGGGVGRLGLGQLRRDDFMPPVVAQRPHVYLVARPAQDDQVLHRGHGRRGLVGHRLQRHDRAASEEAVGGEERLGPRVGQPRGHRPRAIAGEERQDDAADFGHSQQGDDDLRRHGHEQPHGVARAQTKAAQGVGAAVDLGRQFAVGERPCRALLAFPDERRTVARRGVGGPFVDAVVDDVHPPAYAPVGPLDAVRQIDDLRPGHAEANVEIVQHGVGEPGHVAGGTSHQFVPGADAVPAHEVRQPAALDGVRRRPPDDLSAEGEFVGHHADYCALFGVKWVAGK